MSQDSHSTKQSLIDAAVELLNTVSLEEINAVMVLEKAGAAKSSMYHFFEDFSDLLEQAFLQRFRASVDLSSIKIKEVVRNCKTQEELFAALDEITKASQARSNSSIRFERARMLARSERSDRFRKSLGDIQQSLTDSLTEAFQMAQDKGFLNKTFEARTGAVFIQSYTLGRVVDDITTHHMNDDDWNALISRIMRHALS